MQSLKYRKNSSLKIVASQQLGNLAICYNFIEIRLDKSGHKEPQKGGYPWMEGIFKLGYTPNIGKLAS